MIFLELIRLTHDLSRPQQGALLIDGEFRLLTLELPWVNNEDNISCVPEGVYKCVREFSNKFQVWTYELKNVPGRDECKFHWGSYVHNSLGCILTGLKLSWDKQKNEPMILDTQAGWMLLMSLLKDYDELKLKIRHA